MKLSDHLSKQQQEQLDKMRLSLPKRSKHKKQRKPKPKQEEHIDWVDLMGSNNRGLKRKKGGAWTNN